LLSAATLIKNVSKRRCTIGFQTALSSCLSADVGMCRRHLSKNEADTNEISDVILVGQNLSLNINLKLNFTV